MDQVSSKLTFLMKELLGSGLLALALLLTHTVNDSAMLLRAFISGLQSTYESGTDSPFNVFEVVSFPLYLAAIFCFAWSVAKICILLWLKAESDSKLFVQMGKSSLELGRMASLFMIASGVLAVDWAFVGADMKELPDDNFILNAFRLLGTAAATLTPLDPFVKQHSNFFLWLFLANSFMLVTLSISASVTLSKLKTVLAQARPA